MKACTPPPDHVAGLCSGIVQGWGMGPNYGSRLSHWWVTRGFSVGRHKGCMKFTLYLCIVVNNKRCTRLRGMGEESFCM